MPDEIPPFSMNDYVDLSHVSDPRLKAEISRTLDYFASKSEGQNMLKEIRRQAGGPIHLTGNEDEQSAYTPSSHTLNVNQQDVKYSNYYTRADPDNPDRPDMNATAPIKLYQVLWHELEHIQKPVDFTSKETEATARALFTDQWQDDKRLAICSYETSHKGSVEYTINDAAFKDKPLWQVPKDKITFSAVDHIPIEQLDKQVVEAMTQRYLASRQDKSSAYPENIKPFMASQDFTSNFDNADDKLVEAPVIERTNKATKLYYPNDPPRFSHEAPKNTNDPNPVNSGTLSAEEQAQKDAAYAASPTAATVAATETATVSPSAVAAEAPGSPPAKQESLKPPPETQKNPVIPLRNAENKPDFSQFSWAKNLNIQFSGMETMASVAPETALAASPKSTQIDAAKGAARSSIGFS